jgi:hypothetical protein
MMATNSCLHNIMSIQIFHNNFSLRTDVTYIDFWEIVPESVRTAIQCLQYLWTIRDSFPNTAIAYRILLTGPMTVVSA